MKREDCRIGDTVRFGRRNGEQTEGVICRLNAVRCKVRILEQRGRYSQAGTEWGVPYSMLTLVKRAGGAVVEVKPAPVVPKLTYSPFMNRADVLIIQAMEHVYCDLSPENLTGDGELPMSVVLQRRNALMRKLEGLFAAFGRKVSEVEVTDFLAQMEQKKSG